MCEEFFNVFHSAQVFHKSNEACGILKTTLASFYLETHLLNGEIQTQLVVAYLGNSYAVAYSNKHSLQKGPIEISKTHFQV